MFIIFFVKNHPNIMCFDRASLITKNEMTAKYTLYVELEGTVLLELCMGSRNVTGREGGFW